jgi:hypothetical protein
MRLRAIALLVVLFALMTVFVIFGLPLLAGLLPKVR